MTSHNRLLKTIDGCDGFKTGYFRAAGFSIAATATKNGQRAIAVVFGAVDAKVRDKKAKEILTKGLMELVANPPPPAPAPAADTVQIRKSTLTTIGAGIGGLMILVSRCLQSRTELGIIVTCDNTKRSGTTHRLINTWRSW